MGNKLLGKNLLVLYHSSTARSLLVLCSNCLISLQNDLIHAWGLDMQLGYCAQVAFRLLHNSSKFIFSSHSYHTNDFRIHFRVIEPRTSVWLIRSTLSIWAFQHLVSQPNMRQVFKLISVAEFLGSSSVLTAFC